jgi:hypothetical protein
VKGVSRRGKGEEWAGGGGKGRGGKGGKGRTDGDELTRRDFGFDLLEQQPARRPLY